MIYARQIAPEWQESPIFLDGMFPENIVVTGNRDYISRTTAEYDRVLDTLESYAEVLESSREYGYKCATEAAIDLLQLMKGLSRKKSSCLNFPGFQESPYIRRCNWCISFF